MEKSSIRKSITRFENGKIKVVTQFLQVIAYIHYTTDEFWYMYKIMAFIILTYHPIFIN